MVVAHAMLKDPAQRYGSADEFAADLDRVRRGLVPVAATAVHTAIVPHEPTEFVPAAEATRIAPRPEATPLLSGEKLPPRPDAAQALALAVAARAAPAARRRARSRRSRSAAAGRRLADDDQDDGTTTTRRRRPRSPRTKLDDLTGKTLSEAPAALQRLPARARHPEGASACATPTHDGRHRRRERSRRRRRCCTRGDTVLPQGLARAEADPEHRRRDARPTRCRQLGVGLQVHAQSEASDIDRQGQGHAHRPGRRHEDARSARR